MSRKYIAIGLVAGLTAGTGAGLVLQQTGSAGASTAAVSAQPVDDAGTETTDTGTETSDTTRTSTGRGERLADILAPLVTEGTLTQAQADAVVDALVAARADGGWHGPGGHGRGGHGRHSGRGEDLETVAGVLGITVDQLRTELQSGSTVADVAGDRTQAVIDALVAAKTERIEGAVTNGRLTRARADEKLAGVVERVTERVTNGRPGVRPADVPADGAGS